MIGKPALASILAWVIALVGVARAQPVVVTFDGLDAQSWQGPSGPGGVTTVVPDDGNPGACMRTAFNDFGITFFTDANPDFLGDYGRFQSVTIALDIKSSRVEFLGWPASRDWIVELRTRNNPPAGAPWVSVWFSMGEIASAQAWQTFSVTIPDTRATELPPGWQGTGDVNPATLQPRLPDGRTFQSVLAGVDEIAFTTLKPGFVYGLTDFEVLIDNITISTTPRCRADFNAIDGVTVQDLFEFLSAWFQSDPQADFDASGDVSVQDLLAFLSAWFTGC